MGIIASVALVAGLLLLTRTMDSRQNEREIRLVSSQLSFNLEGAVASAANASRSDAALLHLDYTRDPSWGESAFPQSADSDLRVYIVGNDDTILSGLHAGHAAADPAFAFEGDIPGWIRAARRATGSDVAWAPPEHVHAVARLVWSHGKLYLLLASPFVPVTPSLTLHHAFRPILFAVEPMASFLRDNLTGTGIVDCGISDKRAAKPALSVPLHVGAGETVGYASWMPERPGADLRRILLFPLVALVSTFASLVYHTYRRGVVVARELEASAARASHLSLHDDLTKLANRRHFTLELERAAASAARNDTPLSILLIDLDRFKHVNDTYGHQSGDELICEMARRIRDVCRASDFCARLGGDEFVIIAAGCCETEIATLADRVVKALCEPVTLRQARIRIAGSVGISNLEHARDTETLIRQADLALYRVKAGSSGGACFFSPSLLEPAA